MLSSAAGMMLAASAFILLLPGLEAAEDHRVTASSPPLVVAGMTLGVLLMLGLDQFTLTEHDKTGPCGPWPSRAAHGSGCSSSPSPLHNLPEGTGYPGQLLPGDMTVGLPLTTAIAPAGHSRGLAVALARNAPPVFVPCWPCW